MWLVFSKWDPENGRQENKAVRPFQKNIHRHQTDTDTDTGIWEHYDLGEPVLNREGTWARIGWWRGKESWVQTLQYTWNPGKPYTDSDTRAHLRDALNKWTSSKMMNSTGEEKDVYRRMLERNGIFLGNARLAPYSGTYETPFFPFTIHEYALHVEGRMTCYIWNSLRPEPNPRGFWLANSEWMESPEGQIVLRATRILPIHDRDPGQSGPFEDYPQPGDISINRDGVWVRIGYVEPA
ncbi:hypothetical protein F5880DRAFT_589639 [Lentinula raphanica]|nr:hypothetical protein F5880DRAFT_589639 [Lentinula raphanica]